jgi:hypothetical protein
MKSKLLLTIVLLSLSAPSFAARESKGLQRLKKWGPPIVAAGAAYFLWSRINRNNEVSNFSLYTNKLDRFGEANQSESNDLNNVTLHYQFNFDSSWSPFIEYSVNSNNSNLFINDLRNTNADSAGFGLVTRPNNRIAIHFEYLAFNEKQPYTNQNLISANIRYRF